VKLNTVREDVFVVFLSFWVTILIVRYFTFEYLRIAHEYPILQIGSLSIHNFILGLFLVVVFIGTRILTNRLSFANLILLGIGLGLITDEFWLLVTGNFTTDNVYWAVQNLVAILVLGILSYVIMKFLGIKKEKLTTDEQLHSPHKNPENPHVSVVVPALNEENFLGKNLQSILNQDYRNFELIVVDNGSTDRTAEIAEKFGAKVIVNFEKGVGAARQAGFAAAKGKIIATTDADNILPKNWLSHVNKQFENNKEMVAYGGLFRLYSGPLSARIAVRYGVYPIFQVDKIFSKKWSLIGQNMAVRKDAFNKVGGFKHVQIGEDADLSYRLSEVGTVKLNPNFLVYASGRRAKHGLWYGIWAYAPNGVTRMLFKTHKFDNLPVIRQEYSPLARLSFIPLLASVIYLIILFTSMNSTLADAKQEIIDRTKSSAEVAKIRIEDFAGELPSSSSWSAVLRGKTKLPFLQEN
jgi:glycosyltransferase involved in cell wall biosynthesis